MTERRWQPIETAPDDRKVLLAGEWQSDQWEITVGEFSTGRWPFVGLRGRPSHWMPLPEPPGKESENGPRDSSDPCSNGPDNAVVQPGDYIHLIPPPPLRLSADDLIRALNTANSKRRELETALDAARDLMSVIEQDTSLVRAWCDARAKAGKEASPLPSDVAALADRLRRLGQRREMEGIYTDRNICEAAAAKLQEQAAELDFEKRENVANASAYCETEAELTKLRDQLAEAKEALEPFAEHARRNANAMLCHDALEVPVADLRRARAVLLKLGEARPDFPARRGEDDVPHKT